ncbi:MAG: hypothetical protein HQL63_09810 [Magnetococcales bacterium]|nr:hypothetical protein [Magnetococcales bacterium]MBF0321503.1 hypothetical protein [Magnetococcales bacterium]
MIKPNLFPLASVCVLSLLVLQTPTGAQAACEDAACYQKQATDIDLLARKRKSEQTQKKKEFDEWYQYESLRIEIMESTVEVYNAITAILTTCKKDEGRGKINEIMNQLSKIQMRDQDKDKSQLAKQYMQNAKKILKDAQALCKE